MPTYEYACTSCGHRLEAVQSFSDPDLDVCPVCQRQLRKVFGNVGIVLKGSGFYKNDSRNGGGKKDGAMKSFGESGSKESTTSTDSTTKTPSSSDSSSPEKAASPS